MDYVNQNELLNFALDNGMIDMSYVQEQINMNKRQEYLEKHIYKIWLAKDGYWKTFIPDKTKPRNRRLVKKKDRESVENVVVEYWQGEEKVTLDEIFKEWLEMKCNNEDIKKQTRDRYKTDYTRFFKGTAISQKDIRYIDEDELEDFLRHTIKEQNLSNKAYSGLRTLVIGMFKYAKKKKLTKISISQFFGDLSISKNAFQKKRREDSKNVFTDNEVKMIKEFIDENPSLVNYGILLGFQTGLRCGELSVLQRKDILDNILNVSKTEIRYRGEDGRYIFEVQESAKTDCGNREVILTPEAKITIKKIISLNPFGEYLFMEDGERIKGKAFTVKLTKICRYLHIEERSMHKARKTYATKLINGNVDEKIIEKQMGHTTIDCTKNYYYFDNKTNMEAMLQLAQATHY